MHSLHKVFYIYWKKINKLYISYSSLYFFLRIEKCFQMSTENKKQKKNQPNDNDNNNNKNNKKPTAKSELIVQRGRIYTTVGNTEWSI